MNANIHPVFVDILERFMRRPGIQRSSRANPDCKVCRGAGYVGAGPHDDNPVACECKPGWLNPKFTKEQA